MLGDHVEIGGTLKACRRSIEFSLSSPLIYYLVWRDREAHLAVLRDQGSFHTGCQRSNLGQCSARQAPYSAVPSISSAPSTVNIFETLLMVNFFPYIKTLKKYNSEFIP